MLDRWFELSIDDGPLQRYWISIAPPWMLSVLEAQLRAGVTIQSGQQEATPEQMLERLAIERVARARTHV